MRKIFLLTFISTLVLNASILDFQTLDEAKKAYDSGDYEKSAELYKKIAKDNKDEAKFNAADALYKAGKFKKALTLFKSISSKDLQFKKFHNMGNCYAKLEKFDDAIKMYEKALKIKEDKDTRFNLELLKKLKNKKQNQQNKKQSQNSKDKNSKQNSDQNKKGDQKNRNNKKDQQNDKKDKSEQNKKEKQEKKKSNSKIEEKNKQNRRFVKKDEPISDMEVRKWNKVLNQRGIHTLMLPLQRETKGADNEKHPW